MTSQGEVPSSVVSLPADFILQHEISQVETSFKVNDEAVESSN
jgi:hypothetical protein